MLGIAAYDMALLAFITLPGADAGIFTRKNSFILPMRADAQALGRWRSRIHTRYLLYID